MVIKDATISSSDPLYINTLGKKAPYTVSVYAPAGGATTALVKFSTVPNAETAAASNEWEEWLPGTVDASTTYTFTSDVDTFKVTREGGSGSLHVVVLGS